MKTAQIDPDRRLWEYDELGNKVFKGDDAYVNFCDKFVEEYNEGGFDTTLEEWLND
jgi:hypothetical protein